MPVQLHQQWLLVMIQTPLLTVGMHLVQGVIGHGKHPHIRTEFLDECVYNEGEETTSGEQMAN